jgi:hypothetical protein
VSLYIVLDHYRQISPQEICEEAKKYRDLPVADAMELIGIILQHHSNAIARMLSGDTDITTFTTEPTQ